MKKLFFSILLTFSCHAFASEDAPALILSTPINSSDFAKTVDDQWKIAKSLYANDYTAAALKFIKLLHLKLGEELVVLSFTADSNNAAIEATYEVGMQKKGSAGKIREKGTLSVTMYKASGAIITDYKAHE